MRNLTALNTANNTEIMIRTWKETNLFLTNDPEEVYSREVPKFMRLDLPVTRAELERVKFEFVMLKKEFEQLKKDFEKEKART